MHVDAAARLYANALFTVASKTRREAIVGQDLSAFAQLVKDHVELKQVFDAPSVAAKQKRAVVEALLAAAGDVADEVRRLVLLMADRDRLPLVEDVSKAFATRVDVAARVIGAEVTTAVELAPEGQARLAEALGRATGRRVTVAAKVDPAILGGAVARVGGLVFDGSVATQLQRLRQRLAASV
jgi:F-type H+-transporting ATPase subunit delta